MLRWHGTAQVTTHAATAAIQALALKLQLLNQRSTMSNGRLRTTAQTQTAHQRDPRQCVRHQTPQGVLMTTLCGALPHLRIWVDGKHSPHLRISAPHDHSLPHTAGSTSTRERWVARSRCVVVPSALAVCGCAPLHRCCIGPCSVAVTVRAVAAVCRRRGSAACEARAPIGYKLSCGMGGPLPLAAENEAGPREGQRHLHQEHGACCY